MFIVCAAPPVLSTLGLTKAVYPVDDVEGKDSRTVAHNLSPRKSREREPTPEDPTDGIYIS